MSRAATSGSTLSLRGRAAIAVAFLAGFYALTIGIVAGLVYAGVALIARAGAGGGGLMAIIAPAICLAVAIDLAWSVWPRRDRFVPPGLRTRRKRARPPK